MEKAAPHEPFDLLVSGGRVLDPDAGLDGVMDIGIRTGRIASVGPHIPDVAARRVIDASGKIVTAGFIDLHTHCLPGLTYWGVDADAVASRTGVTTWVDAGSASAFMLPGVRAHIVDRATVRILLFLNISTVGLVAPNFELSHLDFCDVEAAAMMAALDADIVKGIKVRMGYPTAGPHGVEPLRRAREVGRRVGLPVMTHIAYAPPGIDEVLDLLGPGDIVTHAFTGLTMKIVDDAGRPRDAVRRARERGVLIDIGHGTGSLSFDTAEALIGAGFLPDTISTDIHQVSIVGPMFDLPMTMTKLLALGMELADIVTATTTTPARILGLAGEVGTIRVGAAGDLAISEVRDETFTIYDAHMQTRQARQRIRNAATVVNGRLLEPRLQPRAAPWMELTDAARRAEDARHSGISPDPADILREPGEFREPIPRELGQ